jgi:hypothetical protein
MRHDNSVGDCPTDTCELFADLFESVDTCDSDTEDVSDPSDGCGFSSIRLHMSDVEAAMSGLNADKRPRNDSVSPFFYLESEKFKKRWFQPIGAEFNKGRRHAVISGSLVGIWHFSIQMEGFLPHSYFQDR